MKFSKIYILFISILFFSCKNNTDISNFENVNKAIQLQYAQDKRVAIYNIELIHSGDELLVEGETNSKKAHEQLLDSIEKKNMKFIDKVRVLPDSALGNNIYAVARNSVINIRSNPKHSAELGTQGLLGMSLNVLDKKGDFYRIQTPDKYISWVDKGGIQLMSKNEFESWNTAKKIIYTKNFGYVYDKEDDQAKTVSDISLGGLLAYVSESSSFFKVRYPDNRIGFVKKQEAVLYNSWLKTNNPTQESIETTSKRFIGLPYLWGGTSYKGVDCSGFTKMVYLINGFVIPRDASQQVNAGKIVDSNLKFEGLQKGDLLFFGTKATAGKKQRVTHVGIWLGNGKGEFIHSAGNVHLSSIHKEEPNYDEFNKNRYLGSRRYLNINDEKVMNLKNKN